MKKFKSPIKSLISISAFSLILACGGEKPEGEIAELSLERDSLINVKKEISSKIKSLEDQIKLKDTSADQNVPIVTVDDIKEDYFKHFFTVQGVIETDKNAQMNSEVGAKVVSINVKEGSHVKKGTLLLELDSRVLKNNIEELKTQIELATTVYEKQKSLWDQKIGSEIQYLEAKTNKESLEKKLSTLYAQLEFYQIKAPFDGLVDEIFPKVGEMAAPGLPLARVINLDHVYLKADVSEGYLGKIKVGDTATINIPSANMSVKTTIDRIGNYINPDNRTFKVRFELENKDEKLIPNMLAMIDILDYVSAKKEFIIPSKLVQQNPAGEEFVFILKENGLSKAHKVLIKTGQSYKGNMEILEGLSKEDKIIVKGARGIKDGEVVSVALD